MRDGAPFHIRGAGGETHLAELAELGGNGIRTWGIEALAKTVDGQPLMDRCHALKLSVTAGIWIAHPRHGFNYADPAQLERQRQQVRTAVRKYRHHPALLMWGLGNEMEGAGDPRIWKELNILAGIVKEEDPHHPVMTAIAGASAEKIRGVLAHYPNLDVLGINAYANASRVGTRLKDAGWSKPFVLSEFGPPGHWEVEKTAWGAAIEPTSRKKASSYYATQKLIAENAKDRCLGTFCFIWGFKQETTATWYGMFLPSGEKLPTVDAMCKSWTGDWPSNRCPRVERFESDLAGAVMPPGKRVDITTEVNDPDGDALTFSWRVMAESRDLRQGGDAESAPRTLRDCIVSQDGGSVVLKTPEQPGAYRLFLEVRDGKGSASVENICFRVAR